MQIHEKVMNFLKVLNNSKEEILVAEQLISSLPPSVLRPLCSELTKKFLSDGKEVKPERDERLDKPIETLGLSRRTKNCLYANAITDIRTLVTKTELDLIHMDHIGKKSSDEIKDQLAKFGLSLGMGE